MKKCMYNKKTEDSELLTKAAPEVSQLLWKSDAITAWANNFMMPAQVQILMDYLKDFI